MRSSLFKVVNSIIDVIFLLDIFVNFRTTFINQRTGDEVFNLNKIAKKYLSTRFAIDALATVPFDTIGGIFMGDNVVGLQLFGVLKLVRVLRLGRIITYMNVKDDLKTVIIIVNNCRV
jgi:hypothetical protein